MATEVVLFEKLCENEVVEAIDFVKNQQKKLRRSEHPTPAGCKERRRSVFLSRAQNKYFFNELMLLMDILGLFAHKNNVQQNIFLQCFAAHSVYTLAALLVAGVLRRNACI
ncbi:MAG: hypothetical protein LBO71_10135 [Prevotellaceae bacterium]|jgi:hypothetical protein|nr:hypothetical protein [Prevotellaceae bacterium]